MKVHAPSREFTQAMRLDVLSLDWQTLGRADFPLHWPVSNEVYQTWAYQYPELMISAIQCCNNSELQIAATAVVSDLACSASRIACAVSDIQAAQESDSRVLFNEQISPVASWLCRKEELPKKVNHIIPGAGPNIPGLRDWKTPIRSLLRSVKTLTTGAHRRIDIQNANDLVTRFIAMDGERIPVGLFPERLPFTDLNEHIPEVRELIESLVDAFRIHILSQQELSKGLADRAVSIFIVFLRDFIGQAYCDLRAYKIWRQTERLSDSLLGGRRKYLAAC